MGAIHRFLNAHVDWHKAWHRKPYASSIHMLIFAIFASMAFSAVQNHVSAVEAVYVENGMAMPEIGPLL